MQVCSFFLFNASRVKKFMIELWLGHFVLSLYLCPPRIMNRYRRVVRETGRKGGVGGNV